MTHQADATTWLRTLDVRPRTAEHYEGNIRLHLIPGLGSKSLAKLTAADVDAFLKAKRAAHMAPRTVHHLRAVLRNALKKAVRNRLIPYNVAAESDAPKVPQGIWNGDHAEEAQTLSLAQVRQLRAALTGSPLEAFFTLAVGLGMREGELLGLRWSDVDLERAELRVRKQLQWLRTTQGDRRRVAALVEPKTEQSRRLLPLSEPAVEALRSHRARWANDKLRLGEGWLNEWDLGSSGRRASPFIRRQYGGSGAG